MWQLLFASCRLFVLHAGGSFVYALPTLLLTAALVYAFHNSAPPWLLAALLVALLFSNTLYLYAAATHMLKNPEYLGFLPAMRWGKKHTDFLLLVASELLVLVLLALYFADSFAALRNVAEQIILNREPDEEGFEESINSVLLFGSRIAAVIFLAAALILWQYLCRVGIRLPAHADGYFLRSGEAYALTRGQTLKIAALSMLFITGVSSIADTASAFPVLSGKTASAGYYPFILPCAYFAVMQLHLAMWVAIYKKATAGYYMSKVLY